MGGGSYSASAGVAGEGFFQNAAVTALCVGVILWPIAEPHLIKSGSQTDLSDS